MIPAAYIGSPLAYLAQRAKEKLGVSDVRVCFDDTSVKPVVYHSVDDERPLTIYPPVVRWRVGEVRYAYVAQPRFKQIAHSLMGRRWTTWEPDYSAEVPKLWKIMKWSAEGKTDDEINCLLEET